jgi:hypothetical protein
LLTLPANVEIEASEIAAPPDRAAIGDAAGKGGDAAGEIDAGTRGRRNEAGARMNRN